MLAQFFGPSADSIFIAIQALTVTGFIGALWYLVHFRCRSLIGTWAEQGGWDVVDTRRCVIATGPFAIMPGMPVYRVELASRSGRTRIAYIRCGNLLTSVLADEVAVEWND